MECDQFTTIPDWIIEHPECAAVFDEFRLDTSCGGKSLAYVCVQQSLSLTEVLSRLQQVIHRSAKELESNVKRSGNS
ncbi:MAG: hypothetical protein HQ518_06370 [Rhodopirellula sp.]|nr:hypothetical protein [Rhodopirellula sp.]